MCSLAPVPPTTGVSTEQFFSAKPKFSTLQPPSLQSYTLQWQTHTTLMGLTEACQSALRHWCKLFSLHQEWGGGEWHEQPNNQTREHNRYESFSLNSGCRGSTFGCDSEIQGWTKNVRALHRQCSKTIIWPLLHAQQKFSQEDYLYVAQSYFHLVLHKHQLSDVFTLS